jgi:C1q domain
MPVPPSTWAGSAPISAHQLNQDLYSFDGSGYGANGINFHANRAMLYDAAWQIPILTYSQFGTHNNMYGGSSVTNAFNVVDTAALFGLGADSPGYFADLTFTPNLLSSAGAAGSQGGYYIMFHFPAMGATPGGTALVGADLYLNGTVVTSSGVYQRAFTSRINTPYQLDLLNVRTSQTARWSPGVFLAAGAGTGGTAQANTNGSQGLTVRWNWVWEGVTTGGATVSTLPTPQTSWTASSTVSSSLLNGNSGIAGPLNFLNYPPMLTCTQTLSSQTISSGTSPTVVNFSSTVIDSYSGFNTSTHQYTVPINGLYLVHGLVYFNDTTSSSQSRVAGIKVNSTNFIGGAYSAINNGSDTGAGVIRVLDLQAGDTVSITCFQNQGSSVALSSSQYCRFMLCWLAGTGHSNLTWTPPDTTFRWQAGTPAGELPNLFQEHLANDLNFLIYRPYFTAYQTSAQSGFSNNVFSQLENFTVGGQVHSTNGDPYNGWNSGSQEWVAPVNGWYLAIMEAFPTLPTTTSGYVTAGLYAPTSGGFTPPSVNQWPPDWYQQVFFNLTSGPVPSCAGIGLYYLLEGESLSSWLGVHDWVSSGTLGTTVGGGYNSQFSIIWMSN